MAIEIERKFLVKSLAFKQSAFESSLITQGFLNSHADRTVRVRLMGEHGFLTIKGKSSSNGLSRYEWENVISKTDAQALLSLCEDGVIKKLRYKVKLENHIFEVDVFQGENKGLIVAEVELDSECEKFVRPDWLGREVTGESKYYNSQLSKTPFNTWK